MSGFTKDNSGFHGIFPNPAGVPNPTRKATETSTSPFTFSRRYLDWNRKTFAYRKPSPSPPSLIARVIIAQRQDILSSEMLSTYNEALEKFITLQ